MKKLDQWMIRSRLRLGQVIGALANEQGIGTVEMILILVEIFTGI